MWCEFNEVSVMAVFRGYSQRQFEGPPTRNKQRCAKKICACHVKKTFTLRIYICKHLQAANMFVQLKVTRVEGCREGKKKGS